MLIIQTILRRGCLKKKEMEISTKKVEEKLGRTESENICYFEKTAEN